MQETDKHIFLDWDDIKKLTYCLEVALKNRRVHRIVAVARGGMVPAAMLANALNIRDVQLIKVQSYSEDGRKLSKPELDPEMLASAAFTYNDPFTLFVDDIVDSGDTVMLLMDHFPRSVFAALVLRKSSSYWPDYLGMHRETNKWFVFPWEKPPA